MKNKLSKYIEASLLFIKKYSLAIVLISFLSVSLVSCDDDTDVTSDGLTALINYDSLVYRSFVLDRAMIMAEPRLAKNTPPHNYNRLILKLIFENQNLDTLNLGMAAYPAKSAGASTHGEAEPPINFRTVDTLRKLPSHLILGNNYVDWDFIKGRIYEIAGTNLKANFSHIIFIPRDRTPLVAGWNGHLHYGFRIVNNDGTIEFPPMGGAGDAAKPSPPAEPN